MATVKGLGQVINFVKTHHTSYRDSTAVDVGGEVTAVVTVQDLITGHPAIQGTLRLEELEPVGGIQVDTDPLVYISRLRYPT